MNSPQQVTLLDAGNILYSDTGGIDIATTDQATIQMSDTPTDPAVAATVFQSLWGNNLWAVKVTRWIAYLRAQTGSRELYDGGLLMRRSRRQAAPPDPLEAGLARDRRRGASGSPRRMRNDSAISISRRTNSRMSWPSAVVWARQ